MHKFSLALLFLLLIPCVLLARLSTRHSSVSIHRELRPASAVQPVTICSGATVVILGETPVFTPTVYTWEVLLQGNNWVNAPGINSTADYLSSALLNASSADIMFDIRRKIISGNTVAYDSFYEVTVQSSPPIVNNSITSPATTDFCLSGTPATLTGSTPIGGNGNFVYRWQSSTDNINFTTITGATTKDYTPSLISTTTYYRRSVSAGNCVVPGISNTITILIVPPVSNNNITAPPITIFCAAGDPGAIIGSAASGGNGTYAYQWQSSTNNTSFINIPGANTKDYTPQTVNATTYYRRSATSGSCTVPVLSNTVTIAIASAIADNTITAPTIGNFCMSGDPANITGSTPSGGDGAYAYQWQSSSDNTNFTDISGANTKDYNPQTIGTTTYYRRSVTSGTCAVPVLSNTVTIVIASAIADNTITAPNIISFCVTGDPANMIGSTPSGGDGTYVYQWQSSTNNTTFTDISGASTKDYNPTAINVTTYYRRSITSGTCAVPVFSNTVTIVIASAIADNTITAPTISNFCVTGDPANISGSIPSGGNGTYAYQWQSSTNNTSFTDISGANTKDYNPQAINVTTYYRRSVTSGTCAVPVLSNTVTIVIASAIAENTLTAPTVSSFCVTGDPANIAGSTPSGGDGTYAYQWQSSTNNTSFTDISGGNTKDYNPQAISTTTYYRRLVTSGSCATFTLSNVVVINVLSTPTTPTLITPLNVTIKLGSSTTLSVDAQPGMIYKWYDSATKSTLLFTGSTFVTPALGTSSTFYVESSNGLCSSAGLGMAQVKIEPPFADIYVPNAFTPNGDGQNDEVHVHGELIKTLGFYVYSQWGELLFTTTDKNRGWDGTYKGKLQPLGVYIYTLRATMNDGQQINKKGTITLLQ
ncbi:gliding motility-associated C-terminal domain-containing protein [Pedobacter duraquae]|uniref:Gliding motility-associated-like protein n=1 Tax=Pedobacter duraquae TaxID=425511 RepID=A0A4V3C3R7_9SPHI|nr:gliding motility-associated C-terminal domain-containing protein [Pedobacter duraquae]TDO23108.1 gliding motility-associated-like protein [Pedobacter duraquae]